MRLTRPSITVLLVLPLEPVISYQCIKLHSMENALSATWAGLTVLSLVLPRTDESQEEGRSAHSDGRWVKPDSFHSLISFGASIDV